MRANSLFVDEVRADLEERVAKRPDILREEPGLRVVASLVGARFAGEEEHVDVLVRSVRGHLFGAVPEGMVAEKLDYLLVNAAIGLTRPEDSNEEWRQKVGNASSLFSREYLERYTQSLMDRAEAKKGICTTITGDMRRRLYDVKALLAVPELFCRDQDDAIASASSWGDFIPPDRCDTEMVATEAIKRQARTPPFLHADEKREPTPGRMRRITSDIGGRLEGLATSIVAFARPRHPTASDKPGARV